MSLGTRTSHCNIFLFLTCIDTPARLKQDLEQIFTLQAEIDAVRASIQKTKSSMQISRNSKSLRGVITALENTQTMLKTQVDELYESLDVTEELPELRGISLDFLRTLLLARELKMNIRKKALGSFFEWERLDRAVGGGNIPLGKSSLVYSASC